MQFPSVCLSICHVREFCQSYAHQTILAFAYQTLWRYSDGDTLNGGIEWKGYEKIAIFDQLYPRNDTWYSNSSGPTVERGAISNDLEWPLTQISRSRYYSTLNNSNLVLHLQWPTNRKSYMVYRTAPFSMTLNTRKPNFKFTPLYNVERLRNGTRYRHSYNEILWTCTLFKSVISNDLEWLSKIFNDTKHRAASLQHLSFCLKLLIFSMTQY